MVRARFGFAVVGTLGLGLACASAPVPERPAPAPAPVAAAPTAKARSGKHGKRGARKEGAPAVPPLSEALENTGPRDVTSTRPVTVAVFDGGRCEDHFRLDPVKPSHVGATSSLTEGTLTHGPERAVDGRPETAWVEGDPRDGVGEGLWFLLGTGDPPAVIGIVSGYAADEKRWRSNQRVADVVLQYLEPGDEGAVEPAGGWRREDLVYADHAGYLLHLGADQATGQTRWVDLAGTWLQDMEITEVVGVELRIVKVDDAGSTFDDTAVSEVTFYRTGALDHQVCH